MDKLRGRTLKCYVSSRREPLIRCEAQQAVDQGAAGSPLVPQNDTKPSYRADSLLPILWEAVIPTELIYGSPRVLAYDEVAQDPYRRDDAVLLEENRLGAATRAACYQQALRRYHSRRVHARGFEEGDLVLGAFSPPRVQTSLRRSWKALTG